MNSKKKTTGGTRKKGLNGGIKFILSIFKLLIIFILCVGCIVGGLIGGSVFAYVKTADTLTSEQLMLKGFTSKVYDKDGNEIIALQGKTNREMVDYNEIPKDLKNAFIAIEDKRFNEHPGVDLKRFVNAVLGFMIGKSGSGGGSTITQQVIKNITGEDQQSVQRKVQEQWRALMLERQLTKDQILDLYMNIVPMGGVRYGVQSAAKAYFDKDVRDLTLAEAASIAGIPNSPSLYAPTTEKTMEKNKKRQEIILNEMLDCGFISQSQYESAKNEKLNFTYSNSNKVNTPNNQPYFVDQVVIDIKKDLMALGYTEDLAIKTIYNNGLKIYTTMDSKIQNAMNEVFKNDEFFTKTNKRTSQSPQASMVIINPDNGHVVALYGGAGEKIGSPLNRASDPSMQRQPGSTIKPIAIYGPAIDRRLITAGTIVDDVPSYLLGGSKIYPYNYTRTRFDGLTTIRDAIKSSVNVVAAKVLKNYLGGDTAVEYLKKAGINMESERANLSLSLGGVGKGVNPLQMAAAYVPFVSQGMYYEPITYTKVVDMKGNVILEKKAGYNLVYQEEAAYVMTDMLKGVTRSGTASGNVGPFINGNIPTAGKTGTTSDNFDKWFVGFTPYYVGATWYGYDRNTTIDGSEDSRAMKIWKAVMEKAHNGLEAAQFQKPSNIVTKTICIDSGKTPTELCSRDPRGSRVRQEIFIKGTQPSDTDTCKVHVLGKVCKDTKDLLGKSLLAGEYCPPESVEEKVFIVRPEPFAPKGVAPFPRDSIYELPGESCNIHLQDSNPFDDIADSIGDLLNPSGNEEQTQEEIENTPEETPKKDDKSILERLFDFTNRGKKDDPKHKPPGKDKPSGKAGNDVSDTESEIQTDQNKKPTDELILVD